MGRPRSSNRLTYPRRITTYGHHTARKRVQESRCVSAVWTSPWYSGRRCTPLSESRATWHPTVLSRNHGSSLSPVEKVRGADGTSPTTETVVLRDTDSGLSTLTHLQNLSYSTFCFRIRLPWTPTRLDIHPGTTGVSPVSIRYAPVVVWTTDPRVGSGAHVLTLHHDSTVVETSSFQKKKKTRTMGLSTVSLTGFRCLNHLSVWTRVPVKGL